MINEHLTNLTELASGGTRNTLFMLMSLDGKISSGSVDDRDVDKDFPNIKGIKDGLYQYYDIEQTTDICSVNSGRVMSKMGINNTTGNILNFMTFVVIDSSHITEKGVSNLSKKTKQTIFVTTNKSHPALFSKQKNIKTMMYDSKIDFKNMFLRLNSDYGIKNTTIQTGSTLNSIFAKEKLIDRVSIVIAPALIGGSKTSSLIGGSDIISQSDLKYINVLKLKKIEALKHSYIHIVYDVL